MRTWVQSNIVVWFVFAWAAVAAASVVGCGSVPVLRDVPSPTDPLPTPPPRPLEFPADHSSHSAETEWWYYSGHLESDAGSELGFHLALFRTGGDNADRTFERIQSSVVDLKTGRHWHWVQDGIADLTNTGTREGALLDVTVGESGVNIKAEGSHVVRASGGPDRVSFELDLAQTRGMMLHNSIGWLAFPLGASYYYTFPRMSASGKVTLPGLGQRSVAGEVWYDHQWGDFVVLGWPSGWYWVGLNLDDGSSLMISEVRDVDGGRFKLFGTFLGADGTQHVLDGVQDGIALSHLEYWTSPETAAEYPIASRITVGSLDLDIELRPAIKDQETVANVDDDAVASYWEGSVTAMDAVTGKRIGRGYLELAGYAKPDPLSWRVKEPQ